jgi:hypothetical protein
VCRYQSASVWILLDVGLSCRVSCHSFHSKHPNSVVKQTQQSQLCHPPSRAQHLLPMLSRSGCKLSWESRTVSIEVDKPRVQDAQAPKGGKHELEVVILWSHFGTREPLASTVGEREGRRANHEWTHCRQAASHHPGGESLQMN